MDRLSTGASGNQTNEQKHRPWLYLRHSEGQALRDTGCGLGTAPPSDSACPPKPSRKEKNMAETTLHF